MAGGSPTQWFLALLRGFGAPSDSIQLNLKKAVETTDEHR